MRGARLTAQMKLLTHKTPLIALPTRLEAIKGLLEGEGAEVSENERTTRRSSVLS